MPSLFDPFYLSSSALHAEIRRIAPGFSGLMVDIGCGTQPYRGYFSRVDYLGIEVAQASRHGSAKRAHLYYDGLRIPLRDGVARHVLCTQVFEHVFEPSAFLADIHRILAPGGSVLMTVPFVWDEHEQPFDFARYSSFGLAHLARTAGFEVTAASRTRADAGTLVQLSLAYLYKALRPLPAGLRKPLLAAISLPSNLAGLLLGWMLPVNPDLYLDNVMVWSKAP